MLLLLGATQHDSQGHPAWHPGTGPNTSISHRRSPPLSLLSHNYTVSFQAQNELSADTAVQLKALSDTSMETMVSTASFSISIRKATLNSPGNAQRGTGEEKKKKIQPPCALLAHTD